MHRIAKFGLFFLLICLAQVCLLAEASAGLRIATYNLQNYLVMDRYLEGRWQPQYPKPEKEKSIVRQIIRETNPDILALQEMGPRPFLDELRADLAKEGLEYPHVIHLSGPDSDRHLAILSKIVPLEVVEHTDLDFKYFDHREQVKRGMLELSFEAADGEPFKLFVVHLKSKYTDEKADPKSQMRRTREAEACRNRIVERSFDLGVDRFLIAGDFNDHPDSGPLRRFYARGDLEIGRLLPAVDSRGEVWTYFFERRGQYSRVDGFVASAEMFPLIVGGRGKIVDSPSALDGSDHRLVFLDLVE